MSSKRKLGLAARVHAEQLCALRALRKAATFHTCSCGHEYTEAQWDELPLVGRDVVPAGLDADAEPPFTVEHRNCACGSTMAVDVGDWA